MKLIEGKTYLTRDGTPVKIAKALKSMTLGPDFKFTGMLGSVLRWWREDGSYARHCETSWDLVSEVEVMAKVKVSVTTLDGKLLDTFIVVGNDLDDGNDLLAERLRAVLETYFPVEVPA